MPDDTLTAKEVCDRLQISRTTLQRRIADGTLPPLNPPAVAPMRQRRGPLRFARAVVQNLTPLNPPTTNPVSPTKPE